jgi:hypothetical protein
VSDLHEDLTTALGAVEPGAAPVEAAMLTGRKIRNARRAGLLAVAVAAVAAVVVGVPALTHQEALPRPVTDHVRVTVNPPGPHSPAGLIASGLIGTQPWTLIVKSPKTDNCMITGDGLAVYACNGDPGQPTAAAPISFEGEGGDNGPDPDYVTFGEVWKDVVSARVELSDGTTLTLHPVEVDGLRYVAFANPASVPVDSVTAYARSGAFATAIPYTSPTGMPNFAAWLRPGQARPREFSGTFGSGVTATAYLGPWGTCLEVGNTGDCTPATTGLGTAMMAESTSAVYGSAAERVSYVIITRKDGTTVRAAAIAVGPQKFWAVPLPWSQRVGARWTAYDDAGKAVGSGSVETG